MDGADDGDLTTTKAGLRRAILAQRDALASGVRQARSEAIFRRVAGLEAVRQAETLLAYASFGSEPVTDPFLGAVLARGGTLLLPRVNRERRQLDLYRVRDLATELTTGVWGIREPDPTRCEPREAAAIDVILVPGVAFDRQGGRIGYGRGYYDRLLDACSGSPCRLAAAFELQIAERVPMGPRDRRVDVVVTELHVYAVPRSRAGGSPAPGAPATRE